MIYYDEYEYDIMPCLAITALLNWKVVKLLMSRVYVTLKPVIKGLF